MFKIRRTKKYTIGFDPNQGQFGTLEYERLEDGANGCTHPTNPYIAAYIILNFYKWSDEQADNFLDDVFSIKNSRGEVA